MKKDCRLLLLAALSLTPCAQAHYHCNVGALSQAQGTPLYFQNGYSFLTNSGFVLTLNYDTHADSYAGFFVTSDVNNITFTSIGTGFFDPPAPGTQVRLRFLSVTGPPGGSFGVWDVTNYFYQDADGDHFNEDGNDATALTFSIPVGTTHGTNSILLSENFGEPGANAFGHIHGRQTSATQPGLYLVTVQAYDASTNGTGGGPIQSPSEFLPIYFQAGDQISALTIGTSEAVISFPTQLGRPGFDNGIDYYLEATSNVAGTNGWETIAGPVSGDDHFHILSDNNWNAAQRFYRLRLEPTP